MRVLPGMHWRAGMCLLTRFFCLGTAMRLAQDEVLLSGAKIAFFVRV